MEKLARSPRVNTVTNQNTPRSIRARLAHPRRKPVPELPMVEPPTQEVARSSSGRMALGPWLGSFGSMGDMGGLDQEGPSSPTLFATSQGRVFADLSGSPVSTAELLAAAAEPAAPVHPDDTRVGRQAMALEVSVLRRKAHAPRGAHSEERRGPTVNRRMRRYRMIGQARKMN